MIRPSSRTFLRFIARVAAEPNDSIEFRSRKIIGITSAIVGCVVQLTFAGLLWQINQPVAAGSFFIFGLLFLLGMISTAFFGRYMLHGYYFFILTELTAFFCSIALGGLRAGGMMAIWALMAPLLAILAHEEKYWLRWFLVVMINFLCIAAWELFFPNPNPNPLPEAWAVAMLILNTLGFALLILLSLRYAIRKNQKLQRILQKEHQIMRDTNRALHQANANLAQSMAHLHATQAQLVQQEKLAALGSLVAGMAHEVNTPVGTAMMAISGIDDCWRTLAGALQENRLSRTLLEANINEGQDYARLAQQATGRTAELVTKFKAIVVHTDEQRMVPLDLASYMPEVVALVQGRLEQLGIRLEWQLQAGVVLHAKPEALTEALTRILANVLDHAFDNGRTGTLVLRTALENQHTCKIEVIDDGYGIAPEHLAHVFDPFFTTRSGSHGHIGLGLHVAYNHVTQGLNGKILVESQIGQGTRVVLLLPLGAHQPDHAAASGQPMVEPCL